MISESRYKSYFIRKRQSQKFKNFVDRVLIEDEAPQRFKALVYDAYAKDIISVSKAASLLNTSVEDVLSTAVFV